MPTLEDYAPSAPFSLEELVRAANSLLPTGNRQVTARTVRYYIQRNLMPPPRGAPKFARYSLDHLRELIELRVRVESGEGLGASNPMMNEAPPTLPERASRRRTLVERVKLAPGVTIEIDSGVEESRLREALQDFLFDIT